MEVETQVRMADLKSGWAVVGNDGHRFGTVEDAGQDYLVVSRGTFSGHVYVPASAIANVEHEVVHLNLAKNEAEQMGWEQPPRAPDAAAAIPPAELVTKPVSHRKPPTPRRSAASTPHAAPTRIRGVHAIVFTPAVADVRAFFRDTLGLPHVDAGEGWLIFALPPAELAVHPSEVPSQAIYLMCDDLDATLASLEAKGAAVRRPIREQAWGFVTEIVLPGGTELAIYQPTHPSPAASPPASRS